MAPEFTSDRVIIRCLDPKTEQENVSVFFDNLPTYPRPRQENRARSVVKLSKSLKLQFTPRNFEHSVCKESRSVRLRQTIA